MSQKGHHSLSLIFPQVTTSGRANYYVSYRREPFAQIKLPKYSLPKVSAPFMNTDI